MAKLAPIHMTVRRFHELHPELSEAEIMMARTMATLDVPKDLTLWAMDNLTTSDQLRQLTEWTEANIEAVIKGNFCPFIRKVKSLMTP